MGTLKYTYTDTRGRLISSQYIEDQLIKAQQTEEKIVQLIGKDKMLIKGYAAAIITSLACITNWYDPLSPSNK